MLDVSFDAPAENRIHTGISSFPRICHQRVFVENSRLVIRSLENGSTSHSSLGGGDDGEVLASDTQ